MWTNISKPNTQSYTKVDKPTNGFNILKRTATGLIAPPTYSINRTIGVPYSYVSKPSTSWTNVPKPI